MPSGKRTARRDGFATDRGAYGAFTSLVEASSMAPIVGQHREALNRPRGELLILGAEAGLRPHDEPAILVIGPSGERIHPGSLSLVS